MPTVIVVNEKMLKDFIVFHLNNITFLLHPLCCLIAKNYITFSEEINKNQYNAIKNAVLGMANNLYELFLKSRK